MCMVDGNASSYSKQLNSPTRMEKYADQNCLVAMLAKLKLEIDNNKKKAKEKKEEKDKQKERNRITKELERERNKLNAMPGIEKDIQLGLEHVLKKNAKELVFILDYYYNVNRTDLNKMRRLAFVNMITTKMNTNIVDDGHNNNIEEAAL